MVVAVICEYNPFHLGHEYQFAQIRARFGSDAVILAVMGGIFSQRGEPYIAPPYIRAKAALACGADLVAELPYPYSAAPAAVFARAGVHIAAAFGAGALAFGSTDGNADRLRAAAARLDDKTLRAEAEKLLASPQGASLGRTRAYAAVYARRCGEEMPCDPNDILGMEYIRAAAALGDPFETAALVRNGSAGGVARGEKGFAAAGDLRQRIVKGGAAAAESGIPPRALDIFLSAEKEGLFGADFEKLSSALLLKLRTCDFLPAFSGGGLYERMRLAARSAKSISALLDACRTKRYTDAEIRRLMLYTLFDTSAKDFEMPPRYTRVFAATARGRALLHRGADISVLVKPADYRKLGEDAAAQFALTFAAEAGYALTLAGDYNFLLQTPYMEKE